MKKIISILLIAVLMFSLAGCGEVEKAETAVTEMLDAFKAQEYEKAQKHIKGGNIKDFEPAYSLTGRDGTMFMDYLFDDLKYEIVSSEKVDASNVKVTVEIEAIDALPVLADFFLALIEESGAEPELWNDKEYVYNAMEDLFKNSATQSGLATVTNKVTIKVKKDGEKWKIIPDEPFVNALYGSLIEAATEINSVFEQ